MGAVGGQPPLFPTAPAVGLRTISGEPDGVGVGDGVGATVGVGDGLGAPDAVGDVLGATDVDGDGLGAVDGVALGRAVG
jgi:hypothetical protein